MVVGWFSYTFILVQVKIDVKINEWFGEFYDMIQKALGAPNSITIEEYWASLLSFITLAAMYVGVAVVVSFLLLIIYLDGEPQWLIGIIAFMIKLVKLKELHKEFRKIQLNFQELWNTWNKFNRGHNDTC